MQYKTLPRWGGQGKEERKRNRTHPFCKRMCKELESVPFPRARGKLGGRVSSYQVTQPLTYLFEPLTVVQIKGLLQTLFMYARCQHPQPLVTQRGHRIHFLMFGKDKYIDSANLVI